MTMAVCSIPIPKTWVNSIARKKVFTPKHIESKWAVSNSLTIPQDKQRWNRNRNKFQALWEKVSCPSNSPCRLPSFFRYPISCPVSLSLCLSHFLTQQSPLSLARFLSNSLSLSRFLSLSRHPNLRAMDPANRAKLVSFSYVCSYDCSKNKNLKNASGDRCCWFFAFAVD